MSGGVLSCHHTGVMQGLYQVLEKHTKSYLLATFVRL